MKKTPKNQLLAHFGLLKNSTFQRYNLVSQNLFPIYLYQKNLVRCRICFSLIRYKFFIFHFVHSVDNKFPLKRI